MASKSRASKIEEIREFLAHPEKYKVIEPMTEFSKVLVCENQKGVIRSYSKTNWESLKNDL